jgi:hypothetical protein
MENRWGADGEQWGGMGMRRSVHAQSVTRVDGSYRSKEGSKKVTGIKEGSKQESARGNKEQGESANVYKPNVYIMIACKCQNDCQLYVYE